MQARLVQNVEEGLFHVGVSQEHVHSIGLVEDRSQPMAIQRSYPKHMRQGFEAHRQLPGCRPDDDFIISSGVNQCVQLLWTPRQKEGNQECPEILEKRKISKMAVPCLAVGALVCDSNDHVVQNIPYTTAKKTYITSKLVYDTCWNYDLSVTRVSIATTTRECLRSLRLLCRQDPAAYREADSPSSTNRQRCKRRGCDQRRK